MIGIRIAALRKKMGLSQNQLAMRINVCASAIGMYEQGRREPPIKTLIALAQVFEVSLDYLITGTDAQNGQSSQLAGALFSFRTDLSAGKAIQLLNEPDFMKVVAVLQH